MHKARQERAALMEQAKKNQEKPKKPQKTTSSSFNPTSSRGEPIYYSATKMDGMGLWCQPVGTNPAPKPDPIPQPDLTSDIDSKIHKEMVEVLQKKCSSLGIKLDQEKIARQQAEFNLSQIQSKLNEISEEKTSLENQIKGLEDRIRQLEAEMDEQCVYQNYAQTQIASLQKEAENERERAESYNKLYEQETKLKEEETTEYQQEVEALRSQVEALAEENGQIKEYLAHLQAENEKLYEERDSLGQKFVNEMTSGQTQEEKAKIKATKMNLLSGENRALQMKVKELEEARKKNQEIMKKKEEEIKGFKSENDSLKNRIKTEQEMRKHQIDLVAQRDSKLKILEERYTKLDQQFQQLLKEHQDSKLNGQKVVPKPKLVSIQARPELFDD